CRIAALRHKREMLVRALHDIERVLVASNDDDCNAPPVRAYCGLLDIGDARQIFDRYGRQRRSRRREAECNHREQHVRAKATHEDYCAASSAKKAPRTRAK